MADQGAVAALFDAAEQVLGDVVNAAGMMPHAPIADLDLEVLDRIYRTT